MEGKNIKVYGTLINHTQNTDASMRDSQHNDLIAVAYQLFDERFNPKKGSGANGAVINIDRYQDIINKRLTALSYDPNGDLTSLYSNLYVSGDTNIGGDLHVDGSSVFEGPTTFKNDVTITGRANLTIGLNDLSDVTLSTMAIGQVLRYDGSKWVNAKLSLSDLQMPAAAAGQVLKFNGTEWVAAADDKGTTINSLNDLSDVDTTGKSTGQALVYDATSGKWKPGTVASGGEGAIYNVFGRNVVYKTYNTSYRKIAWREDLANQVFDYGDSSAPLHTSQYKKAGRNRVYLYVEESSDTIPANETIISSKFPSDSIQNSIYVYNYAQDYTLFHAIGDNSWYTTVDGQQRGPYANDYGKNVMTDTIFASTTDVKMYYNTTGGYYSFTVYTNTGSSIISQNDLTPNLYLYAIRSVYGTSNLIPAGEIRSFYSAAWDNKLCSFYYGTETGDTNNRYIRKYKTGSNGVLNEISTTISQDEYLSKLKWSDGSLYQTVPFGKKYIQIEAGDDCVMPDVINAVTTTQSVTEDTGSSDYEMLDVPALYTQDGNTAYCSNPANVPAENIISIIFVSDQMTTTGIVRKYYDLPSEITEGMWYAPATYISSDSSYNAYTNGKFRFFIKKQQPNP